MMAAVDATLASTQVAPATLAVRQRSDDGGPRVVATGPDLGPVALAGAVERPPPAQPRRVTQPDRSAWRLVSRGRVDDVV